MQVAVNRMIASVGSTIVGSSPLLDRTSPGAYITTPRMGGSPSRCQDVLDCWTPANRIRPREGVSVERCTDSASHAADPWWWLRRCGQHGPVRGSCPGRVTRRSTASSALAVHHRRLLGAVRFVLRVVLARHDDVVVAVQRDHALGVVQGSLLLAHRLAETTERWVDGLLELAFERRGEVRTPGDLDRRVLRLVFADRAASARQAASSAAASGLEIGPVGSAWTVGTVTATFQTRWAPVTRPFCRPRG